MRTSLMSLLAVALACSAPATASVLHRRGTSRAMLASAGEVHDAVRVLFSQDPRIQIQDAKDEVSASWLDGTQPVKVTAVFTQGPSADESDVEVICEGPRSADERRRVEEQWLDKIPSSVKYYGLQIPPDLRSPLDEGPRAALPDEVPSVDRFRRY